MEVFDAQGQLVRRFSSNDEARKVTDVQNDPNDKEIAVAAHALDQKLGMLLEAGAATQPANLIALNGDLAALMTTVGAADAAPTAQARATFRSYGPRSTRNSQVWPPSSAKTSRTSTRYCSSVGMRRLNFLNEPHTRLRLRTRRRASVYAILRLAAASMILIPAMCVALRRASGRVRVSGPVQT